MTQEIHHRRLAGTLTLAIIVAVSACVPPRATDAPSASAAPSAPPAASGTPITPTPEPTTAPTGSAEACELPESVGRLPSDRFTSLRVAAGPQSDELTFVFGNPSLPGPSVPPEGRLEAAIPPYAHAGSGAAIQVAGEHVLQIRFSGMSLSNDVGQETYTGPTEIKPDMLGLRHAVLFDASEGVVGWYVGYDGTGCVTLAANGNEVTVSIAHS